MRNVTSPAQLVNDGASNGQQSTGNGSRRQQQQSLEIAIQPVEEPLPLVDLKGSAAQQQPLAIANQPFKEHSNLIDLGDRSGSVQQQPTLEPHRSLDLPYLHTAQQQTLEPHWPPQSSLDLLDLHTAQQQKVEPHWAPNSSSNLLGLQFAQQQKQWICNLRRLPCDLYSCSAHDRGALTTGWRDSNPQFSD
jgi:hypothetical protein